VTDQTRLEAARLVAEHWREWLSELGEKPLTGHDLSHPLRCVLAALDGETDPWALGVEPGSPTAVALAALGAASDQPANPTGGNVSDQTSLQVPNQEAHRIATTAIIFRDDGRMLITKRAPHKKVWPNRWTVPGGGLETDDYTTTEPSHPGSTPQWYNALEQSLRREVREEVGLEVSKPWLVCDLAFIRPDGVPVVVLSYAADLVSGEVTHDEDTVAHAWVTVEEAAAYDLIDGIHEELRLAAAAHPRVGDPARPAEQRSAGRKPCRGCGRDRSACRTPESPFLSCCFICADSDGDTHHDHHDDLPPGSTTPVGAHPGTTPGRGGAAPRTLGCGSGSRCCRGAPIGSEAISRP
jgi:8-oxo-dGTP pyrophosphatase MutT (NUDIX family)